VRRAHAAAAAIALVLAGCGGNRQAAPPPPRLPVAVARSLLAVASDPERLQRRTIAAINANRIPAALQEPLLSRVNAFVQEPTAARGAVVTRWIRSAER
jgi:hypothetical protein